MLVGHSPWDEDKPKNIFQQIKDAEYEFEEAEWNGISQGVKDLIRDLLVVDPEKRMTVKEALENPWVTQREGDVKRKREEDDEGPLKKRK